MPETIYGLEWWVWPSENVEVLISLSAALVARAALKYGMAIRTNAKGGGAVSDSITPLKLVLMTDIVPNQLTRPGARHVSTTPGVAALALRRGVHALTCAGLDLQPVYVEEERF